LLGAPPLRLVAFCTLALALAVAALIVQRPTHQAAPPTTTGVATSPPAPRAVEPATPASLRTASAPPSLYPSEPPAASPPPDPAAIRREIGERLAASGAPQPWAETATDDR